MGNKILGLDLGTNSIGWAVVEEEPVIVHINNEPLQSKGSGFNTFGSLAMQAPLL